MHQHLRSVSTATIAFLALGAPLKSQTIGVSDEEAMVEVAAPPQGRPEAPFQPNFKFKLNSSYTFPAKIRGNNGRYGSMSAWEGQLESTARLGLGRGLSLQLGGRYETYQFGGGSAPLPGALQASTFITALDWVWRGQPLFSVRASPGWYYGDEITSESFHVPFFVTTGWRFTLGPESSLLLTVGVAAAYLDQYPVIPIGGLIWQINKEWTLIALFPDPRLTYALAPGFDLFLNGSLVGGQFYVEDPRTKGDGETWLDYYEWRLGLGLQAKPTENFSIGLSGGWSFMRSFEYERRGPDYSTEGAPYLRLEASVAF